jgi:hypothetical protein
MEIRLDKNYLTTFTEFIILPLDLNSPKAGPFRKFIVTIVYFWNLHMLQHLTTFNARVNGTLKTVKNDLH